ncbi:MAG: ECF RNA polymerase sigma factor SigK [Paracidovorax wautersii]|uniref:ECF RNA polymerase sigma factor SigK n=1 Tax=Paracidovorax wautersii TaxID=1177982 RepID=A0A7V8FNV2_9BURK|nr:MAG: ECF RNA polymerase sigma factor SigK [Paracidovorax wautersii]
MMSEPAFAAASPPDDDRYPPLLARCARGDQAALRALYDLEGARLLGVVQRIVRDPGLAEDLLHDTFVKVWTRAATFDAARGSARGWLYSIARHLALNAVRDRQAQAQTVDEDVADVIDDQAALQAWRDTQDAFAWADSAGRVRHCLEQLEPVRRNCVLHAYVDGLTHHEIAQRLGAPLGTVKAWIKRSLAALKACLA